MATTYTTTESKKPRAKTVVVDDTPYAPASQITYGSDPELMIFDLETGRIASALKVMKNDKHKPFDLGDGIRFYADNVLCELAFPPAKNPVEMVSLIGKGLQAAQDKLGPRYRMVAKASHAFDACEMDDDKAWEAGCNPNFDAYADKPNMAPDFQSTLRTGSFHLHLGWARLSKPASKRIAIQLLDLCVGVPSILFDHDDTAKARRELYGKAGEYRPTPYGVEYRVLGNYPLRSPKLTMLVYDLAYSALSMMESYPDSWIEHNAIRPVGMSTVRRVINEVDALGARAILHAVPIPERLMQRVVANDAPPDLYRDWNIKV